MELIEILLVEDNPGDVRLTRDALKDAKVLNRLQVVGDGQEALDYLRREGKHADAKRPDLILLDLNLPRKDGRQVLAEMGKDQELRKIPVAVLTVSEADEDVHEAFNLHAKSYVTKPIDVVQLLAVVRTVGGFGLGILKME